jgi:hypothetical protein
MNPWFLGAGIVAVLVGAWAFGSRGDDAEPDTGPLDPNNPTSLQCDEAYATLSTGIQDAITQAASYAPTDGGAWYRDIAAELPSMASEPYPARSIVAIGMGKVIAQMTANSELVPNGPCNAQPGMPDPAPFPEEEPAPGPPSQLPIFQPLVYTKPGDWMAIPATWTAVTDEDLDGITVGSVIEFRIRPNTMSSGFFTVQGSVTVADTVLVTKVVERDGLDPGVAPPSIGTVVREVNREDVIRVISNPAKD